MLNPWVAHIVRLKHLLVVYINCWEKVAFQASTQNQPAVNVSSESEFKELLPDFTTRASFPKCRTSMNKPHHQALNVFWKNYEVLVEQRFRIKVPCWSCLSHEMHKKLCHLGRALTTHCKVVRETMQNMICKYCSLPFLSAASLCWTANATTVFLWTGQWALGTESTPMLKVGANHAAGRPSPRQLRWHQLKHEDFDAVLTMPMSINTSAWYWSHSRSLRLLWFKSGQNQMCLCSISRIRSERELPSQIASIQSGTRKSNAISRQVLGILEVTVFFDAQLFHVSYLCCSPIHVGPYLITHFKWDSTGFITYFYCNMVNVSADSNAHRARIDINFWCQKRCTKAVLQELAHDIS